MKNNNKKRGFTIVELVIVIAVIGILAAVLIPTFTGLVEKARQNADQQIVYHLNTAIKIVEAERLQEDKTAKCDTMHETVLAIQDKGYLVDKLTPTSNGDIVWDSTTNRFALIGKKDSDSEESVLYYDETVEEPDLDNKVNLWKVYNKASDIDNTYSAYLADDGTTKIVTVNGIGFDSGSNTTIEKVTYTNSTNSKKTISIRTNGGELNIDAYVGSSDCDTITHYGYAEVVDIVKNGTSSYHEGGTVPFIKLAQGKLEVEEDGFVNAVHIVKKTESSFDSTIDVVIDSNDVPKFTRDAVTIPSNTEVKVCTLEIEKTKEAIYLTMDGIYEQVKVATVTNSQEGTRAFIEGDADDSKMNTAVDQISNVYTDRDDEGNINPIEFTSGENTVTVTFNESTRQFETTVKDSGNNVIDTTDDIKAEVQTKKNDEIANGTTAKEAKIASELKGGTGLTANDPFEIYDYYSFQKISEFYDLGYRYFKIKDGVTVIDCSGWSPVYLNGSFDGNGVVLNNVTATLFQRVGYELNNDNVVLQNYTANMNVTATQQYGVGTMIKQIDNAGTTTFSNITIHGYMEGFWNVGSFYSYGTANYDDVGCDYTVVFNNCHSDATLVCATGNTCGGMIGHIYEGTGHKENISFNNSEFTGKILTTSGEGHKWYAMSSANSDGNDYYIDGVKTEITSYNQAYNNVSKIAKQTPTKQDDGYYVNKVSGASKIVVSITGQIDAYGNDGTQIANLNGITIALTFETLTSLSSSTKVMDLFTNVELINEDGQTMIEDGILKIYTNSDSNYKTGTIRLQVNQYSSNGQLLACGTLDIASCSATKIENVSTFTGTETWTVK